MTCGTPILLLSLLKGFLHAALNLWASGAVCKQLQTPRELFLSSGRLMRRCCRDYFCIIFPDALWCEIHLTYYYFFLTFCFHLHPLKLEGFLTYSPLVNTCWLRECKAAALRASPLLRCCIFSYQSVHKIVTERTQHILFNFKTILQPKDIPHYSKEKEKHYFHTFFFFPLTYQMRLFGQTFSCSLEKERCLVQRSEAIQPTEEPVVLYLYIIMSCTLHCFCLVFLLDAQSKQASYYMSSDWALAALDVGKKKCKKKNHTGCFFLQRRLVWSRGSRFRWMCRTESRCQHCCLTSRSQQLYVCLVFFSFASVFLYKMYLLYC